MPCALEIRHQADAAIFARKPLITSFLSARRKVGDKRHNSLGDRVRRALRRPHQRCEADPLIRQLSGDVFVLFEIPVKRGLPAILADTSSFRRSHGDVQRSIAPWEHVTGLNICWTDVTGNAQASHFDPHSRIRYGNAVNKAPDNLIMTYCRLGCRATFSMGHLCVHEGTANSAWCGLSREVAGKALTNCSYISQLGHDGTLRWVDLP